MMGWNSVGSYSPSSSSSSCVCCIGGLGGAHAASVWRTAARSGVW